MGTLHCLVARCPSLLAITTVTDMLVGVEGVWRICRVVQSLQGCTRWGKMKVMQSQSWQQWEMCIATMRSQACMHSTAWQSRLSMMPLLHACDHVGAQHLQAKVAPRVHACGAEGMASAQSRDGLITRHTERVSSLITIKKTAVHTSQLADLLDKPSQDWPSLPAISVMQQSQKHHALLLQPCAARCPLYD